MDGYSPDFHVFVLDLRQVQFLVTMTSFQDQGLEYRITFEQVDGFLPNLYRYIIWTILIHDYILVSLISFSRGLKYAKFSLKMIFLLSHWLDSLQLCADTPYGQLWS